MANTDFTVADVLAWARTKPADGRYSFSSISNCALCQFLRDTDRAVTPWVGGYDWIDASAHQPRNRDIPEEIVRPLLSATFGELVSKLEKLCPETPVTKSDWLAIDAYLTDIEQVSA